MNTGFSRREHTVVASMRAAIAAFDTDHAVVRVNMYKAHDLFRDHLLDWSEDFCTLYNQMLEIYCAYTPMPTGHYRHTSIEVGYTSHPVKIWVNDKVQPPKPTAAELVARFDALIDAWNARGAAEAAGRTPDVSRPRRRMKTERKETTRR